MRSGEDAYRVSLEGTALEDRQRGILHSEFSMCFDEYGLPYIRDTKPLDDDWKEVEAALRTPIINYMSYLAQTIQFSFGKYGLTIARSFTDEYHCKLALLNRIKEGNILMNVSCIIAEKKGGYMRIHGQRVWNYQWQEVELRLVEIIRANS